MKRFVTKVQNLSQKAADIQKAIQSVPPKISEIRETVAVTAGQLQQLRSSIQSSVTDLRMDNPDHILEALQEIHDAAGTFAEAGYDLRGVDMELSPVQRLVVHLDKYEDVPHPAIRALVTAHQARKTIHALLSSLLQAEAVADRVALSELTYRTLVVHVGPIPSVRLSWRTEEEEPAALSSQAASVTSPAPIQADMPAKSAFSQSSYFESRSIPSQTIVPALPPAISGVAAASSPAPPVPSVESAPAVDWKQEALDRLKKNPHQSKYSR
ncbi:MAG TPA: hypothetical protein VEH04_03675 [Verrucomicrobiae bacterium]|nr:hypothetical protein [Verrucomicrobiae bacterium]